MTKINSLLNTLPVIVLISDDMQRATGGSSIFINTNLIHSPMALDTELQAVAVRVSFAKTVTLCSIYVPPKLYTFGC